MSTRTEVERSSSAGPAVGVAEAPRPRSRTAWRARSRFAVHLGLLAGLAGALATLQLLHVRVAYHAVVGLAFGGLVVVHLLQRRHRIGRMLAQLAGMRTRVGRELRILASDTILAVLTVNVVLSGVVDWGRGTPSALPLSLPPPFGRWHAISSILLVGYLVVHVARRWRRIRRSTIR